MAASETPSLHQLQEATRRLSVQATESLKLGAEKVAVGVNELATAAGEALEKVDVPMVPTEPDPTVQKGSLGIDRQDMAIRVGAESAALAPEAAPTTPGHINVTTPDYVLDQVRKDYEKSRRGTAETPAVRPPESDTPRYTIESFVAPNVSYEHRPRTLPKSELLDREKESGLRDCSTGVPEQVINSRQRAQWRPEGTESAEATKERGEVERELMSKVAEEKPTHEAISAGGRRKPDGPIIREVESLHTSEIPTALATREADSSSSHPYGVKQGGNWNTVADTVPRTRHGGIANGVQGEGAGEIEERIRDAQTDGTQGTSATTVSGAATEYPRIGTTRKGSDDKAHNDSSQNDRVLKSVPHHREYVHAAADIQESEQPTEISPHYATARTFAPTSSDTLLAVQPADTVNDTVKSADMPPSKSTAQGEPRTRSPARNTAGKSQGHYKIESTKEHLGNDSNAGDRENPSAIPTAGGMRVGEEHFGESKKLE